MPHRLYYWQQKLGMTRIEAVALFTVLGLFSLGLGSRFMMTIEPAFDDETYAEVDSLFALGVARMSSESGVTTAEERASASSSGRASASPTIPTMPLGKIDVNRASAQELQQLPGIGPALAQRIVEYREHTGRFSTVDQLTSVSGIGPKTLDRFRAHVTASDVSGD